jgi:hypothetical protein
MCERMHVAGRLHALLQRRMQRLALALGEVVVAIKASLSLLRLLSHGGWLAAPRLRAAAPAVARRVRAGPTKGAGPCEMCQGQRESTTLGSSTTVYRHRRLLEAPNGVK